MLIDETEEEIHQKHQKCFGGLGEIHFQELPNYLEGTIQKNARTIRVGLVRDH